MKRHAERLQTGAFPQRAHCLNYRACARCIAVAMPCRPTADVCALRGARTRSPSARSRCALRSMPPRGRHHCALRSRRRPRARRLPIGRRPPAERLSRRVGSASLDGSQRSPSLAAPQPTLTNQSRSLNRSNRLRGWCKMCICAHKRAFGTFAAPNDLALRGFSAMRCRLPRKGKAAGPLHPAALPKPVSMPRLAQRSISSSMLRTASFAAWMPSPFAMPAML